MTSFLMIEDMSSRGSYWIPLSSTHLLLVSLDGAPLPVSSLIYEMKWTISSSMIRLMFSISLAVIRPYS
jgi:hypothetical protein